MSEVQIAIIDEQDTQITLAVPGVQGPSGAISSGGSANQVFYKVSGTNYDAGWTFIGNANVDAAAAIAGTKISPNFGSQATVTTGTNTAASFIPTSATIPSNGIYLPGANQVGVATNGVERVEFGTAEVVFNDGGTDYDFRVEGDTSSHLLFVDASTDRVGIGTSSPGSNLHVTQALVGNDVQTGAVLLMTTATAINDRLNINFSMNGVSGRSRAGIGAVAIDAIGYNCGLAFYTRNAADSSSLDTPNERMRIDSSGRVGIGTTSPSFPLHIVSSTTSYVAAETTGTGTSAGFRLKGSASADYTIFTSQGVNQFAIYDNAASSQRLTIDSSGRLLVGTSTAVNDFDGNVITPQIQLEGTSLNTSSLSTVRNSANSGGPNFCFGKSRSASVNGRTIVQYDPATGSGDNLGEISFEGANGTDFIRAASIKAELDGTPGVIDMPGRLVFSTTPDGSASPTERMRIKADGDVSIVTGNLIIGTAGKGIDFSANGQAAGMNSELLDDYEEGTWTFAVTTTTGSVTMNSSFNNCWYIKIGALVTVGGTVTVGSVSSPTGAIIVTLPFAMTDLAEEADYNAGTVTVGSSVSKNARDFAILTQGGTEMRIYIADVATLSSGNANAQQLQASSYIAFQLSYVSA